MKEKEILENLRVLLGQKRNEYIDMIDRSVNDSNENLYNYYSGKKELIDDIIAYIASQLQI